ncbi:uncharacterized protein [Nicotiana tomentosiformis]|uniref:uncharacterized protein n=1 Tax=Nicotiana tomentosiformis TaxID=4098 RepID=UPI00388C6D1E
MVEGETEGRTSRATEDISRGELGIIDISESPQILDVMIREASMLEGRSYEGIQEPTDIHDFLDGLESAASEEIIGFDLAAARDKHEDMAEQVQQRLEQIGRLNLQVDELMDEEEKFKENMDILASKMEAVQAQLESVEAQLRAAKENASVQIERVKELQSRLDLATSDKASLANELEVARSEVAVAISEVTEANKRADAKVDQFRIDVEVNQAKAKSMVEHAKWQAQREALEGVIAQGFDVEFVIENAKAEETRARRLAFPEEDSDSSSESEGGEDPEDTASDEDQATYDIKKMTTSTEQQNGFVGTTTAPMATASSSRTTPAPAMAPAEKPEKFSVMDFKC